MLAYTESLEIIASHFINFSKSISVWGLDHTFLNSVSLLVNLGRTSAKN